ncbi:MAG: hypothetical protein KGJ13_11345 [Patescibacteria group bacterium]|nr:hypothetical protein [Patescibacteria group bacterium]
MSQPNGTTLDISAVRLSPGVEDDGWIAPTYAQALQGARQFYQTSFPPGTKPAQNAGATGQQCVGNPIANGQPALTIPFGQPMIVAPTITTFNPSAANANWRDTTASADVAASVPAASISQNGFTIQSGGPVTTVNDLLCIHWTADGGI